MNHPQQIRSWEEYSARWVHGIEAALEEQAKARANARRAEALRKRMKAIITVERKDDGCSLGEAENRAVASTRYQKAEDEWFQADLAAEIAISRAEALKLQWEEIRSNQAMSREQMRLR